MPTAEQTQIGIEAKISELEEKRAGLMEGGGAARIAKQHQAGKLSARERVDRLTDQRQLPGNRNLCQTSCDAVRHGR